MSTHFRVLVIDDEPMFRNLIVTMLRRDCIVAVATEGSEGFYKALEQVPDVVFVDVQMPGWDGLKTLKSFKCHPTLSNVKVIMLTADTSKETILAAIHAGANDYLIKTHLTRESLFLCLEKLLPGFKRQPLPAAPEPVRLPGTRPAALAASVGVSDRPRGNSDKQSMQEILDSWE